MPKTAKPLNDTQIKALRPKAKRYAKSDGGGLVLEVMTSGTKIWRYRYSLHGKQQPTVTIGDYPAISLTAARDKARSYAQIVAKGESPVANAKQDRGTTKKLGTVREFGDFWINEEISTKSAAYQHTAKRVMEKDVYPFIGNKALSEVNPGDVLAICDRIKNRGAPKMALTTRNLIKLMFEYAGNRQMASVNPAKAIGARFITTQESRTRVLTPDEIGQVLRAVYASDIRRSLKLAIHLLVLTMVRKSELIEARWSEIDLEAGVWRIPADRMKQDREHWVYLAPQAVAMFAELKETRTSVEYVFPTVRGVDSPIAKSTLNKAIKALFLDVQHFVLHDFRRTASTHLHEMGYSSDAIEKALAHTIKGIKGVYNRAEYADARKEILKVWATFVDAQIDGDRKVVIGKFKSER
jgi:integrase